MKLPRSFIKAENMRKVAYYELSLEHPNLKDFLDIDDKLGWRELEKKKSKAITGRSDIPIINEIDDAQSAV